MQRLILIDGNSILHRAFHALPPLTTSKGIPINAVFGFTSMLLKVFSDLKPDYVACCFDVKGKTFRHKEYKEYKATRPKMAEELVSQVTLVHKVVETMGIPIYEMGGYEADDVIGTLAFQARSLKLKTQNSKLKTTIQNSKINNDLEIIIVTGDRDTLQLVDKTIKVYCPLKGLSNPVLYDENLVKQKYGLLPKQLIDYKTLVGDPSDNIPGIEGIGEKTATELLQKYGTIEEIYQNLALIKEGIRKKLEAGKKDLELAKKLVTIVLDVPVILDLEKCKLADYNRENVVALFRELEFNSLIPRLPLSFEELRTKDQELRIKNQESKAKKEQKSKKDENQLGLF